LIEQAYREAEAGGVALACQEEAGREPAPPRPFPLPAVAGNREGIPGSRRTKTSAWGR
jgi:hypothetical protein